MLITSEAVTTNRRRDTRRSKRDVEAVSVKAAAYAAREALVSRGAPWEAIHVDVSEDTAIVTASWSGKFTRIELSA